MKRIKYHPKPKTLSLTANANMHRKKRLFLKKILTLESLGVILTFSYFYVLYIHFDFTVTDESFSSIKDISSVLGGVFSPVAFLWLVIGTISNSYHQKKSFQWLEDEKKSSIASNQPVFTFKNPHFTENKLNQSLIFNIKNVSEPASLIKIHHKNLGEIYIIDQLEKGDEEEIKLDFILDHEFDFWKSASKVTPNEFKILFEISYIDKNNSSHKKYYKAIFNPKNKGKTGYPVTIEEYIPFMIIRQSYVN